MANIPNYDPTMLDGQIGDSTQSKINGIKDERAARYIEQFQKVDNNRQQEIINKINNNRELTIQDIMDYKLTEEDKVIYDRLGKLFNGERLPNGIQPKDFLSIAQAKILVPKITIEIARKAADPVYLCSKFYKTIAFKGVTGTVRFPVLGVIKAHDIAEGQEYPEESFDWNLMERTVVNIQKSGVRISLTDELLEQCEFDILSILVSECGRALARWREEKCFHEFMRHGCTVFDNSLRDTDAAYGTSGVDYLNNPNDTLSIDDLLDLIIALHNNDYTPSDVIMHPIIWTVFAKNGLTGAYTAVADRESKPELPNGQFKLGPGSVQGRMPFALNVDLSPFAPINKGLRTYSMFAVDRNNVGMCLERHKMATDKFNDPSRDLSNIKFAEAYGYATLNEGRAIACARNISMDKSYPIAQRVYNIR